MAGKKNRKGGATGTRPAAAPAAAPPGIDPPAAGRSSLQSRRFVGAAIVLAAVAVVAVVAAYQWTRPAATVVAADAASAGALPPVAPHYVGGSACTECHADQAAAWKGSDHDLAMQAADDKSVLGNFANAKFTYAGTTSMFLRRDGKFIVNTDGPDGKLADYEIKYTFGVHPLQQYLIEFPGGRMQALGIAWDSRSKAQGGQRWFHLYPGQAIKAGDPLHWTGVNQNWNFQCAECHSTNLRKNFDARSSTYKTTWSEINVSCEACHGPASNHVSWAKKQGDWQSLAAGKGLPAMLDERKGVVWTPVAETGNAKRSTPRQTAREIETCARCHGRASRISDDYVHGKPLLDTHRLALLEEGLYWNDGQMRDEVYNWGSFVQSRMHAAGVTCSDCHDPHTLQLKAAGNGVCAQCHLPAKYDASSHTHHKDGTAAAACTACHMPTTTYMVVDPRHDHSLRIPRPDLSVKLGVPNACNACHAKQSPQWAATAIHEWTGKPPASFQNFAAALQAGTAGSAGARGALLAVIDDNAQPAIARASAIERLGHWLTPVTEGAVARALNDPDSIVRLAAVEALANAEAAVRQRYLPRMLDDSVRTVRMAAARALVRIPPGQLGATERAAFDRALAEYVAAQTYIADRPEGRMGLGNLYADRGDADAAIAEYRSALALDPTFVAADVNLADLHRSRGLEDKAEAALREGLARNPRSPQLLHTLGLALVRQKRAAESMSALREAARLAPDNPRFAYVYAVALNDAGKRKEAVGVLEAALARHPDDRDALVALAHFSSQSGDRDLAQRSLKQLRELDPENAEYAQMAKDLGSVR